MGGRQRPSGDASGGAPAPCPIRTIVAGVALLGERDPVLAPVVALAERLGASLHLVHAFDLPALVWEAYSRRGYTSGDALRRYTEDVQAELATRLREMSSYERVRLHVVAGPAATAVQEIAGWAEADLIVVGPTRRGPLARTFLGTTAQRVLRGAPAPVLVLRAPLAGRLRRVLLATDLSFASGLAHEIGLDLVRSISGPTDPELRSLFVAWYDGNLVLPPKKEELRQVAEAELREFLRERKARPWPVGGTVRLGDPVREIVAEAVEWQADLVVLGTHGRTAGMRMLLGSIAEAVLRNASANVLVVPASTADQPITPVPLEPSMPTVAGPVEVADGSDASG